MLDTWVVFVYLKHMAVLLLFIFDLNGLLLLRHLDMKFDI